MDRPGLDGAAHRRFRAVVVGDVRVEVRATLPDVRFADVTGDHLSYAPTRAMVAGTAVNLARRAVGYFRDVAVLARVGDDDFTPVIRQELRRLGVRDLLRPEPGAANGVAVMLRDAPSPDAARGVRLLVAGPGTPDRRLSAADVCAASDDIGRADLLCLDGYALLAPVSRDARRTAVELARRSGTAVAFDLVPHDIDARLPAPVILAALRGADVVISEAPTAARLLGRPAPHDAAGVRALLPALDAAVPGHPLWLLRCGPSALEHVVAHRRGDAPLEYPSGYGPGVERAGFGDRLAAAELYWWLTRRGGAPRAG